MLWKRLAFLVIAFALIDAVYLAVATSSGGVPPCTVGGCELVLTSQYSHIGGISLSWFGIAFDLSFLALLSVWSIRPNKSVDQLVVSSAVLGVFVTLVLLAIEVFFLHAYCLYCMVHGSLLALSLVFVSLGNKYSTQLVR